MASADISKRRKRGRNFIQSAIQHPGALTKQARVAGMSPMMFAKEHKSDSGTTGKRARLALTLRKLAKRKKRG